LFAISGSNFPLAQVVRQKIIRLPRKANFGSGEKAILALVVVIVIGRFIGA